MNNIVFSIRINKKKQQTFFLLRSSFCATDMMDEWDEDPDDFLNYRHQRRLSDPSANLNNYSRYGWKTKATGCGEQSSKARSENEGLDSLASEVSEIEAGDLRDGKQCTICRVHFSIPPSFMVCFCSMHFIYMIFYLKTIASYIIYSECSHFFRI